MTTERTTATNSTQVSGPLESGVRRTAATLWSSLALALGIVTASAYGLLAAEPYRDLPAATVLGAQAQDVCSILVAGVLVFLVRRSRVSPRGHLARLGLLAYVVYSYAIYLTGVPMNRVFLVYVVIETLAGTLFTALWAGAAAVLVTGETLHLGPDAGPSAALLVASIWLTARWLRALRTDEQTFLRPSLWED
jgi:hypothetical protein